MFSAMYCYLETLEARTLPVTSSISLTVWLESRFEDDLSFDGREPTACRIWARHLDFKGENAVCETTPNL